MLADLSSTSCNVGQFPQIYGTTSSEDLTAAFYALDYHTGVSVTVAVGLHQDTQLITTDQGVVNSDVNDQSDYPVIAIFPPPFDAVNFGSESIGRCDIEAAQDSGGDDSDESADAEPVEPDIDGGVRRLSSYTTPAVPTYFHFTINTDARITEAMFSDVAVFQENSKLIENSSSWQEVSGITASESFFFVALYQAKEDGIYRTYVCLFIAEHTNIGNTGREWLVQFQTAW